MFSGDLSQVVHLWEESHSAVPSSEPHVGDMMPYVLSPVLLALITWLRFDLPGLSWHLLFSHFVITKYFGGDTLRLYRYLVSA